MFAQLLVALGAVGAAYGIYKLVNETTPAIPTAPPGPSPSTPVVPAIQKCVKIATKKSAIDLSFELKKAAAPAIPGFVVFVRKTGLVMLPGTKSQFEVEEIWMCPPGENPPAI